MFNLLTLLSKMDESLARELRKSNGYLGASLLNKDGELKSPSTTHAYAWSRPTQHTMRSWWRTRAARSMHGRRDVFGEVWKSL